MPIDDAIKELVSEALGELKEEQQRTAERCAALEQRSEELGAALEEKTKEAEELRNDLAQKEATIQDLDSRLKALEELDPAGVKGRVERLEDDPDGLGGLKQVLHRLDQLDTHLKETLNPLLTESNTIARTAKTATDDFVLRLREFERQSADAVGKIKAFEERLVAAESMSAQVQNRQQKVEDIEAGLESTLRNEILLQLDDFKSKQLQALQVEFDQSRDASASHIKSLVHGALELVARATRERKTLAAKRDLMLGWREQAWISGRRKMGILALHNFVQRRNRAVYNQWTRVASTETVAKRLRDEFGCKLASETSAVKAALEQRCVQLDGHVRTLREESCPHSKFDDALRQQGEVITKRMDSLESSSTACLRSLQDHFQKIQGGAAKHSSHEDRLASIFSRHEEVSKSLGELSEGMADLARKGDVQGLVRDLVLLWNSVKQLDSAKAVKADVDAMSVESSNRERLVVRRIEELEKRMSTAVLSLSEEKEQDVSQVRWDDLNKRLEESSQQLRHWEQMWERLAGFVEDLVQKVGELQGEDKTASTLRPPGAMPSSPMPSRGPPTGGSTGSFLNHDLRKGKMPKLSPTPQESGADTTASSVSDGGGSQQMETKKLWSGSTKSLLQEASRGSDGPAPAKLPRSRPSSASARRSHDRPGR